MSDDNTNHQKPPAPEQLVAFFDGELRPEEQGAVQGWLNDQPTVAAELADWRRLASHMQSTVAPEPMPDVWARTRLQIETALATARRPTWTGLRLAIGFSAAAAILVAIFWQAGLGPFAEEPYPVAETQDVVILSIDPSDAPALVVGEPPAAGPIVLASLDDVTLVNAEPHVDGVRSDMWVEQGAAPMIVPLNGAGR